ncbi:menaquinone-specific isochorismate synthase [Myxococcaceae bacterium]|nr:menaquinone-specific isochorismate synthase [Myxococcaceae bacterium]
MKPIDSGALRELESRAREALRAANASGTPRFASLEADAGAFDPFEVVSASEETERFFFEDPGGGSIAAIGAELTLDGAGPRRLEVLSRRVSALGESGPMSSAPVPLLVGGFSFAASQSGPLWRGFPQARFVLPSFLFERRGGRSALVWNVAISPGDDPKARVQRMVREFDVLERAIAIRSHGVHAAADAPAEFSARADRPHSVYRLAVRRALEDLRAGALEKVVLARSCTLSRPGGFDPVRALAALRTSHPACYRFARTSGEASFVGATPERLVRKEGLRVETQALAGSAPRGKTPADDERLGAALRESKKEQQEHAIVVRALRAALAASCESVSAPEAPALLRLDSIQHLHTPIEARLLAQSAETVLDLAARLHPSPAIAGFPREAAVSWLRRHEELDRGWYAGAVGWLRSDGDGELAVALRTALLRGDEAVLHAGAGIVEGSIPEAELAETRIKLRAGLAALVEI